ncbi:MAG: RND family efflux transporter MFP subunit [Arcticibacterium sp.]|jgi:RND family efflux transporter MFP subunit
MKKLYYTLSLGLALLSCTADEEKAKAKEELQSVSVAKPEMITIGNNITGSGMLSSKSELKLAFKSGGLIKRMYVKEGQYVKKGQLLAELDMSEIDAGVNQVKLGLAKAERDLVKAKKLVEDEIATRSTLEDAQTGYNLSKERLDAAVYNQRLSRIYAPKSGKILMKIAEEGELITPFAPALVLAGGASAFNVNIGLADKDIVKVKLGEKAKVYLDAYPEEVFMGKVSQIAQSVNPATGTYEVELTLNGKGKRLLSGFMARANILSSSEKALLMVPIEALVEADEKDAFVFLLEGGIAKKTAVKIGQIWQNKVEVMSGLNLENALIVFGANFLSDGQKVNVSKE